MSNTTSTQLPTALDSFESYCICSISEFSHDEGVQVEFGYNVAGAIPLWSAYVPDGEVNAQLFYNFNTDLDTLIDCVDAGELTEEEAKEMLMESLGDTLRFDSLLDISAL